MTREENNRLEQDVVDLVRRLGGGSAAELTAVVTEASSKGVGDEGAVRRAFWMLVDSGELEFTEDLRIKLAG